MPSGVPIRSSVGASKSAGERKTRSGWPGILRDPSWVGIRNARLLVDQFATSPRDQRLQLARVDIHWNDMRAAIAPSGNEVLSARTLPSPSAAAQKSTSQSAGLVHSTAFGGATSTIRSVLEVPSVMSENFAPSLLWNTVSGPTGTWYVVFPIPAALRTLGFGIGKHLRHFLDQRSVVRAVPGLIEMELLVKIQMFQKGKHGHAPT